MKQKRAFTLTEVMMSVALITIVLSVLMLVVTRLSRLSRITAHAALRRKHWVEATEQLRWQLRNCYLPIVAKAPEDSFSGGLVGGPEVGLWGEPNAQEGQDSLSFLTSRAKKLGGVCEVGYRLLPRAGQSYNLVYREFSLRNRAGLHSQSESSDAPWRVLLDKVNSMSIDYSADGWTWRRDWTEPSIPRRIRIRLEAENVPVMDFQVTPGMGGGRW